MPAACKCSIGDSTRGLIYPQLRFPFHTSVWLAMLWVAFCPSGIDGIFRAQGWGDAPPLLLSQISFIASPPMNLQSAASPTFPSQGSSRMIANSSVSLAPLFSSLILPFLDTLPAIEASL